LPFGLVQRLGKRVVRLRSGKGRGDELAGTVVGAPTEGEAYQRKLAARLGWDQKVISKLERRLKRLTVLELIEMARLSISIRVRRRGAWRTPRNGGM
jgi:hypothetical protein